MRRRFGSTKSMRSTPGSWATRLRRGRQRRAPSVRVSERGSRRRGARSSSSRGKGWPFRPDGAARAERPPLSRPYASIRPQHPPTQPRRAAAVSLDPSLRGKAPAPVAARLSLQRRTEQKVVASGAASPATATRLLRLGDEHGEAHLREGRSRCRARELWPNRRVAGAGVGFGCRGESDWAESGWRRFTRSFCVVRRRPSR